MSTLRVSNIEAKADASSPTIDEKVKVTSSQGRVLVQIDGKTAGITSIGINTTSTSFTIDGNQNVQFVGIITAANLNTTGVTTFNSGIVIGTGTSISSPATNTLTLGTNNAERLRVSAGGVSIGSIATYGDSNASFTSLSLGGNGTRYGLLEIKQSNGVAGAWIDSYGTGGNGDLRITTAGTSGAITFWTGGAFTEKVRIDSSGNLGIGITNPSSNLTILNTVAGGNGALLSIQNRSSSSGTKCGIMFSVDTSDANWSDVGNAQIIMENTSGASTGQLKFRVYDSADSEAMKIAGNGSGNYRNGVAFARAGVALDNSWDGFPSIAVFNTDGYGNTSNRSEFRIHGINYSYASYPGTSGSDFGTNLRIDGSTYFSSDARHKTNIVDNPYGLNEILQLQPRKFNRINSDGQIEENQGDILGFIAQEVREVIPEAVNYYPEEDIPNENGWCRAYSLSDSYIVSTLVNAVKEQNTIIETLISRIESLESQINT